MYRERNRENVKVSISKTYRAVSTGEMRRATQKQICVAKLHSVCTSHFYRHFANQLKPQALENTDERTLKLQ